MKRAAAAALGGGNTRALGERNWWVFFFIKKEVFFRLALRASNFSFLTFSQNDSTKRITKYDFVCVRRSQSGQVLLSLFCSSSQRDRHASLYRNAPLAAVRAAAPRGGATAAARYREETDHHCSMPLLLPQ